jgi:3-hydroxyisobutyrate dehydrogenase-like beta-hydroxyacid dehydrogenase
MTEVTILGAGAMGSALAQALLGAGRTVTAWNRTAGKLDPLVRRGAQAAPTVAAGVAASPVTIVCVDDYTVTRTLLGAEDVHAALRGRVLVQLSTGTPEEARQSQAWAGQHGIDYLDGAILAYPQQIATPDAAILVAGSATAYRASESLLQLLAPGLSYLGDNVGAASATDCAMLSYIFGALLGAIHGARICESEGLSVDEFGALLASLSPVVDAEVKHVAACITAERYERPTAALRTYAAAANRLVQQAKDAGIDDAVPASAASLLRRAMAAGYGAEELAAVVKVLRGAR